MFERGQHVGAQRAVAGAFDQQVGALGDLGQSGHDLGLGSDRADLLAGLVQRVGGDDDTVDRHVGIVLQQRQDGEADGPRPYHRDS